MGFLSGIATSLIEWALEKIGSLGLTWWQKHEQTVENDAHKTAEDELSKAQTDDQIKQATRDIANNP